MQSSQADRSSFESEKGRAACPASSPWISCAKGGRPSVGLFCSFCDRSALAARSSYVERVE